MSLKKSFISINTLKKFDAFAKPLEEVQIKTVGGGIVSLVCFLTIGYLMMINLFEYLDNTPTEELFVDTSRNKKLQINLDIIIPRISCDYLALDAVDSSGEQHLHVDHNIYKRRLDLNGVPLSDPKKTNDVGSKPVDKSFNSLKAAENSKINISTSCGSCYGAETSNKPCCNTCEDVQRAYALKSWNFNPSVIEQCKNQPLNGSSENTFKEGCQIFGTLQVNRVGGSFHIAPGTSFSINNMHVHDVHPYTSSSFNTSHKIRHLSFGQKVDSIPGDGGNPLDSSESIATEGSTMFQYYLKIVPTLYQRKDKTVFSTNQFSVTKHNKIIAFERGTSGMPGVFFSYELSPIMVKFTERQRLLGHLITQFLCNISGVFICFWIIDLFMYKISKMYNLHTNNLPKSSK
ncbi:endoplasmic reticulum-Golgi intermediate compartment protein 3 [Daktulosphaira vitifoliae]|uniref:endoplasmic reticulum-Golgi intermediate compartment protein 3 n=1 Tax=Daktulosphaira vitifoliae TaxID=58002 RepID=UPI0021AAE9CF|nr:endoplasmic reticulum-Golgi intermediate compartment protein 3 [Daktulosphaira vitifoliae]